MTEKVFSGHNLWQFVHLLGLNQLAAASGFTNWQPKVYQQAAWNQQAAVMAASRLLVPPISVQGYTGWTGGP